MLGTLEVNAKFLIANNILQASDSIKWFYNGKFKHYNGHLPTEEERDRNSDNN